MNVAESAGANAAGHTRLHGNPRVGGRNKLPFRLSSAGQNGVPVPVPARMRADRGGSEFQMNL